MVIYLIRKVIFALLLMAVFISCASANELNETIIASDFDDLSAQIDSVAENQTIYLEKDYQLTDNSQKHIVIDKSMTIDGKNHTVTSDTQRAFWVIADNVVIKNINFINSKTTGLAGGVISWWGNNGTLKNCNFSNNSASSAGGAVLWKGNDGIISSCNFENNDAGYGKAVTLVDGEGFDPSMIHIQVVNSEGGALYISGNNAAIDSCTFTNNAALLNGGAISVSNAGTVSISNSKFKNNNAKYNGGAVDLNANSAKIINSTFENNSPNDLFNNCPNTQIISSSFKNKNSIDSWYEIDYINVSYGEMGYFDELESKINEVASGGTLTLDKDYEYLNGSNKGILISKPITIDGAGHTLNGNRLSRMFNITSDNVILKNINFINGNSFGRYGGVAGGGAIYWSGANGLVENCNFTDNAGSGIEDDPFDKEETIVTEDGQVIHIIRVRPMGAKTNEGGAIVWTGNGGTVSKCRFIHNTVGYPNTGGAICWRGDDGKVMESVFLENDAWCGSAIAWVGNNGFISKSTIANSSFFDGGIYWFGENGVVVNSMLLGNKNSPALRPMNAKVTADYNFWGDTLENPNQEEKISGVNNWLVMKFTHNGEFVVKGQKMVIKYDITNLIDRTGNVIQYDALIDRSGQLTYTADKTGFLSIGFQDGRIIVEVDSREVIASKDLTEYYSNKISFSVNVSDIEGKVIAEYVKFTINKKTYMVKTDKNGVATLKIKLKPGKYTVYISYGKIRVKNKIVIKNTLITKNISKKYKKSAKFKVKVLNSKGKPYKKQTIKIKFKGKTYKFKTNKKGIAIFNVPKNLKVGKHKIKTTCNGLTNTNRIRVRR